jgi:hypothetical protein
MAGEPFLLGEWFGEGFLLLCTDEAFHSVSSWSLYPAGWIRVQGEAGYEEASDLARRTR